MYVSTDICPTCFYSSFDGFFFTKSNIQNELRPCPNCRLRLQLWLGRARLLFLNTDIRADLAVAVAKVANSDTALVYVCPTNSSRNSDGFLYKQLHTSLGRSMIVRVRLVLPSIVRRRGHVLNQLQFDLWYSTNLIKGMDTFGNCERPVFSLGVSIELVYPNTITC